MYTKDHFEQLQTMGALGYQVGKILTIMEFPDPLQFEKDFADTKSEVSKAYHKGAAMAEYSLDVMIFEQAQSGDLKALSEYKQRKAQNMKPIKKKE
jgi:hypothetical protein